jgi:uncharacterized protein (TIGR03083 family)
MQTIQNLSLDYVEADSPAQEARNIPKLTHREAGQLATVELERTLSVLESLSGDDWQQQTACTLWNVRQLTAHLSGACASHASWSEFKRVYVQNPYIKEADVAIDGINRREVEDRADAPPAALIEELREAGPKAIRNRQRVPWPVRVIPIPFGPPLGTASIGYLTDLIYGRDMWMHRLDICRATGREMALTADHDGRIVALVMRDLGRKLHSQLGERTIRVELTGLAGGIFDFGSGSEPTATIRMDALDFTWLTSERMTVDEAISMASTDGDPEHVKWFLDCSDVPY